jgi:hypothetical protein
MALIFRGYAIRPNIAVNQIAIFSVNLGISPAGAIERGGRIPGDVPPRRPKDRYQRELSTRQPGGLVSLARLRSNRTYSCWMVR